MIFREVPANDMRGDIRAGANTERRLKRDQVIQVSALSSYDSSVSKRT